jgi:transposase-like protein
MAAAKAPKQRAPYRRWPLAEKRRIVELTLAPGASTRAIAREQGVHPNSLCQWKALYRAGKLDAPAQSVSRARASAAIARFVPVSIAPAVGRPAARLKAHAGRSGVVQLVLGSGDTLRIETGALDAALVCALVAELRR